MEDLAAHMHSKLSLVYMIKTNFDGTPWSLVKDFPPHGHLITSHELS